MRSPMAARIPCAASVLGNQADFFEYVIMPLFLIVWHVEAIREAGSHLPLSKRSILRMPLAKCSPVSLPVFNQLKIVLWSTPSCAAAPSTE
jgi:hypothetical protein